MDKVEVYSGYVENVECICRKIHKAAAITVKN
jgi:hypothetical protein